MSRNGLLAVCLAVMLLILAFTAVYTAVGNYLNAGYAAHKQRTQDK